MNDELKPLSKAETWRDKTISEFITRPVRYIIGGVIVIMVVAFLVS